MIIPVRCYTCGKVVGDKWEQYKELLKDGKKQSDAFEIIGLKRYCCKRIFLGHVDVVDVLMKYDQNSGSINIEKIADKTDGVTEPTLFS